MEAKGVGALVVALTEAAVKAAEGKEVAAREGAKEGARALEECTVVGRASVVAMAPAVRVVVRAAVRVAVVRAAVVTGPAPTAKTTVVEAMAVGTVVVATVEFGEAVVEMAQQGARQGGCCPSRLAHRPCWAGLWRCRDRAVRNRHDPST